MRQAAMTAPGKIEYRDVPEPKPGPGQVLLRIARIGICGSDLVTGPLESKHFPFEEWLPAYQYIERQGPRIVKVFIDL